MVSNHTLMVKKQLLFLNTQYNYELSQSHLYYYNSSLTADAGTSYLLFKTIQTTSSLTYSGVNDWYKQVGLRQTFTGAINDQLSLHLFINARKNWSVQQPLLFAPLRMEVSGIEVVTIKTAPFIIRQGVNSIDRKAFANAQFSFAGNSYGKAVKQSGNLPEAEYDYCFEVEVYETKDLSLPRFSEQCFTYAVQPLTPLLLINPIDEDELCIKPNFIWQPPMPLPQDARFKLILVEMQEKQDVIEAISFNTPIINQLDIRTNTLFYPPNAPALKEDQKYAWQVWVYDKNTILKKSEIWTFTVRCSEKGATPSTDSYRELKETIDGNFYATSQLLRFSFTNPYRAEKQLRYTIDCLSDPSIKIKKLPELTLATGLNKFEIDLSEFNSFKENKEYLLTVFLADNRQLKLRFLYKK